MDERLIEKLDRLGAEAGIQGMTPEIRRFALLVRADMVAQPVQEPVAFSCLRCATPKKCAVHGCSPNTWPSESSPKRPWVGLTFAEICEAEVVATEGFNNFSELKFARAIEAKLKEKNT